MLNLTTKELSLISESYRGGLLGIEKDLMITLNSENVNNLITKKTKHLSRIDLSTVKSMIRGEKDGGN